MTTTKTAPDDPEDKQAEFAFDSLMVAQFLPCFGPFMLPPVVAGGWWCVVVRGGERWLCGGFIQTCRSNFSYKPRLQTLLSKVALHVLHI